jgi:signal transduction histidine kinase
LDRAEFGSNPQVASDIRHHVGLAVKEAVHNAVKHSQTEKLALRIAFADGSLIIEVRDWGKGFVHGSVEGRGLENMRHRAQAIGAALTVESVLDVGTVVRFEIPGSFRADRKV